MLGIGGNIMVGRELWGSGVGFIGYIVVFLEFSIGLGTFRRLVNICWMINLVGEVNLYIIGFNLRLNEENVVIKILLSVESLGE